MEAVKRLGWQVFSWLIKPLWGKGLGRLPLAMTIYRYLYTSLVPQRDTPLRVRGHKMFIHQGDLGFSEEMLFGYGYDKYQTILFQELTTESMNVIDLGAHIGYYTLLAAKLVGDKGKVFAFEPEPQNYDLLLRNIEVNGYKNVIPVRKAAFNKTGKVNLLLGKYSATHSLYHPVSSTGAIVVDAVSLDEFFEDRDYPIDIIKMDIQGAEMTAIMGMSQILKKSDNLKIFTEFWPSGLQEAGFSPREYWDKLIKCGFKFIYLINEQKQRLEATDFASVMRKCKKTLLREADSVNLLCSKFAIGKDNIKGR